MHVKVLVARSYLILCDPMHCSLPGSSVHGILQAWILEWVAVSFSRGSSEPRDLTRFPTLQADSLQSEPLQKRNYILISFKRFPLLPFISHKQELGNFMYIWPDSKDFRLHALCDLCFSSVNWSALLLCHESIHRQCINEWYSYVPIKLYL